MTVDEILLHLKLHGWCGLEGVILLKIRVDGNAPGREPPHRTPSPHHQGQCDADERSEFGYGGCAGGGQKTDERCDVEVVNAAVVEPRLNIPSNSATIID